MSSTPFYKISDITINILKNSSYKKSTTTEIVRYTINNHTVYILKEDDIIIIIKLDNLLKIPINIYAKYLSKKDIIPNDIVHQYLIKYCLKKSVEQIVVDIPQIDEIEYDRIFLLIKIYNSETVLELIKHQINNEEYMYGDRCMICDKFLSISDHIYFENNPEVKESIGGYVCGKHQCECMPFCTPWSYIGVCDICKSTTFCKACKGGYGMCQNCSRRQNF
jgi:hypothetical protein